MSVNKLFYKIDICFILQSQPDVGQTPFGLGGLGGLAGLGNLGMGSANFMEMQQRMQREVRNLPFFISEKND